MAAFLLRHMGKLDKSEKLFKEAQLYLPGGVDSPVRAFKAVRGIPPFIQKGKGSKIYDVDGNEYIDYVCSWGPLILGHADKNVVKVIKDAAEKGTSFGASIELEIMLARQINEAMPSIEMLRFVNSGTEATMSALRLARAYTGKDKIIKFEGGYHGHSDGLLAKSGSGLVTLGIPDSPGVPRSYAQNTLIAEYNNMQSVEELFTQYSGEIAALIVEPVAANMGVIPPMLGFLESLRNITTKYHALLIFDEVITGFRVGYGGAQAYYHVYPDLTCLGKIIGGGLPVGAYGGKKEIMKMIAPLGAVYQAGTLSGNPLAMAAGLQTLKALKQSSIYKRTGDNTEKLEKGIIRSAKLNNKKVTVSRVESLLTVFFIDEPVYDYASARRSNTEAFKSFHNKLLERGIYWPPSQFEAAFVSAAHKDKDIETTIKAIDCALI